MASAVLLSRSHPTWVRGLKHLVVPVCLPALVAPYVGAWIETLNLVKTCANFSVAPYVGAWIETAHWQIYTSLYCVAPYVGAWIETHRKRRADLNTCRTLRGCVD